MSIPDKEWMVPCMYEQGDLCGHLQCVIRELAWQLEQLVNARTAKISDR